MKISSIFTFAFLAVFAFAENAAAAQITINVPKIPKFKRDKPKTETPVNSNAGGTTQSNNSQSNDNQAKESGTSDECDHWWVASTLKDINAVQEDVETYTPDRRWLIGKYTYDHLLFAISPNHHNEFYTDKAPFKNCPVLVAAYKKLSDTAAKMLPLFVPDKRVYAIQTPANTKVIHSKLTGIEQYKILFTGVQEASWLIDKNDFGIPTSRYKHGLVWFREINRSHPYCWIYYFNIVQDYGGGGTYGDSYSNYVGRSVAGCPAGS